MTIFTSKILKVTSEMKKLMIQLAPVLLGGMSAPLPLHEGITTTIVEIESRTALPAPITDIMEELTLKIVGQFFITMRYCIELIFFGWSPFEFVRSLLENQVENIRQTGGFDHEAVYQALVEQLGIYSNDLKNLERANPAADAQRTSDDLRIKQEQEQKEIEEQIIECTHHIDTSRISYQGLTNNIHQSEVVF